MKWFKKKEVPIQTHPEVRANKNTRKIVVKQAKQSSKQLNEVLEENHFTLYLAVATGARLKPKGA